MEREKKHLAVFFTHGVSLELWEKRGIFSREIRFYEALAREVSAAGGSASGGGEVWFFTYGRDDARFASRLVARIHIFPKRLPIPDLLYGLLLPFLYWRELFRVHVIRIHQMAGVIPALITHWLTRKPLVVRAGFQWYSFAERQQAPRLKLWLISFIEQLAYRSARAIIHTTAQDVDFVTKRYHVDTNKLHVIPNYVDTELFKPIRVEKHARTVCFVGRLEEQKNVQALIEAMKGIEATLLVYGDGSLKKELEEQAQNLHVDVQFRDRIANEDLPAALNACTIFVLPSLYEGNPKVLLEAMACGLPVVGTDVDGISSVVIDQHTGLLCKTDSESIQWAITKLLDDPALRSRLGEAAREAVLASCSLTSAIQAEIPLYQL